MISTIILNSIFMVLLMDVFSSRYVKEKYGKAHAEYSNIEEIITPASEPEPALPTHIKIEVGDQISTLHARMASNQTRQRPDNGATVND